ncbi:MAG: hypothetical protein LBT34_03380 [Clostridiales Family XIII bacterium]|jgi:hypothetical protein|nr:hypothetical protein [Clostridiales Family XIII bacterium]
MEEALILLLGGDRDMQTGKVLSRLSFEDVWTQELLHTGGPAPSNPVATEDGSRLFFCGATDTEPYRYPLRRQLYVLDCADGNVT